MERPVEKIITKQTPYFKREEKPVYREIEKFIK